jgi:chromosome segregation ATPase
MELRDVITTETSAFAERLIAAAEAAAQKVQKDADAEIAQLHGRVEKIQADLEAQTDRADAAAAQLASESDRAQQLSSRLEAETARVAALAGTVEAETKRADAAAAQLETEQQQLAQLAGELEAQRKTTADLASTLEAEKSNVAQLGTALEDATKSVAELTARLEVETSARAAISAQIEKDRSALAEIAAKLEAETSHAVAISAQLDTETSRVAALTSQLEAHGARTAALAADLEAAEGARAQAEAEWLKAQSALEQAAAEAHALNGELDAARAEASQAARALEGETKQRTLAQQTHDAIVRDLQTQLGTVAAEAAKARASLAEAESRVRDGATSSDTQLRELQVRVEQQAEMLRTAEARATTAEGAVASMREEVEEANALTDATSTALTGIKDHARRVTGLLNGAAAALAELAKAATTAEVFKTLVHQLSGEFERVAIFRVKEKHLIGDIAEGLDTSLDIKKIVIPTGMNSLVAKAASGSGVEQASKEQMADAGSPFGGSPTSALAAALVFEGEVLAVAYADSDAAFTDAHGPYAGVLIRHANAILASLAQELRAAKHLREYAHTLIHEAEVMFKADLDSGVPEKERIERLRASVGFARDLYSQRAALEAPLSSDLLEEEMAEVARDEQPTAFSTALGAVMQRVPKAKRTAS